MPPKRGARAKARSAEPEVETQQPDESKIDILDVCDPSNGQGLLEKMGAGQARQPVSDRIRELSRKQLEQACAALENHVTSATDGLGMLAQADAADAEHVGRLLLVLRGAALLSLELLRECHQSVPPSLLQAATTLHDKCLLALDASEVQDAVAKLCCAWWEMGAAGKEYLAAQALLYLLDRATSTGRATDIKAVYSMRAGLELFDYEDPSINDLKRLLLLAAMHPGFLHRQEGRKLLAYIFQLHLPLIQELTAIIKNQVPGGRRSVLEAYGEIIYRAWRDSAGSASQHEIESTCIQELMQSAILASTAPLAAALRVVLGGLHIQKKSADIESLLARLYEPILFRAFGAANAEVRRNALHLLVEAFPIRDADATPEETDESLTRQFQMLLQCMDDNSPAIRETAVRGITSILNSYWELIPAPVLASLLSKLTGELAYDSTSPAVRVAVLESIAQLVDNPHAQPVLKKVLPQVAALLHDPVLKVREAMASLLATISRTRSLHFYDVVGLDICLAVMATDSVSIARQIQQILVPSYFPNPEEGSLHVVNLLKVQPEAGQAFCTHLVSSFTSPATDKAEDPATCFRPSVPVEHVLQLFGNLKNHMLATVGTLATSDKQPAGSKRQKQRKGSTKAAVAGKKRRDQDDAEQQVDTDEHETPATWASWAAGLASLAQGLLAAVEAEECGGGDVNELLASDELCLMLEASPSQEARVSILHVATALSFTDAAAALRADLYKQLGSGQLPAITGPSSHGAAQDSPVLVAAAGCLCAVPSGAKLLAYLMKAVGLREPATIHVPVGNACITSLPDEDAEEEDRCCCACGSTEDGDTMLLCDGCNAAYHTACLKPALKDIPNGDWFCHICEQEIQGSCMSQADALRCFSELLKQPRGRGLIHEHKQFEPLLTGLRGKTQHLCQQLVSSLRSGQPAAPDQDLPEQGAKPKAKKGKGNKAAQGSVIPAAVTTPVPSDAAPQAMKVMCRAALHMALMGLLLQDDNYQEAGGDTGKECLELAASILSDAQDMAEQVMEAVHVDSIPANLHAALSTAGSVLGVLCDAHHLNVLYITHAGSLMQVQRVCALGCRMVAACMCLAKDGVSGSSDLAQSTYARLLMLLRQLGLSLAHHQQELSSAAEAGDTGAQPAQRLEPLLEEAAVVPVAASRASTRQLALTVMGYASVLLQPLLAPDSASLLLQSNRHLYASTLNAFVDQDPEVVRLWINTLAELVGAAVVEIDLFSAQGEPEERTAQDKATSSRQGHADMSPEASPSHSDDVQPDDDQARGQQQRGRRADLPPAARALQEAHPQAWAVVSAVRQAFIARNTGGQGMLLDQLVALVADAYAADNETACIGALSMLTSLNMSGLKASRLKLSGSEADIAIRLELLTTELQSEVSSSHQGKAQLACRTLTALQAMVQ